MAAPDVQGLPEDQGDLPNTPAEPADEVGPEGSDSARPALSLAAATVRRGASCSGLR